MTMVSVCMWCSQVHNSVVGVVRGGHRRLGATEGLHSPRIESKCSTGLMGHQSIVPHAVRNGLMHYVYIFQKSTCHFTGSMLDTGNPFSTHFCMKYA